MEKEKSLGEELGEMAPRLSNLKKNKSQRVPEGYFESLPDTLIQRLSDEQARFVNHSSGKRIGLFSLSAAAAVIFAVMIATFLLTDRNGNAGLTALSAEEAYIYVVANVESFDQSLLVNNLDEQLIGESGAQDVELDALYNMVIDEIEFEDLELLY